MKTLVERMSPRGHVSKLLILCAIGGIAAFGQAPWGLWPLTLIALAVGMIVIQGPMSKRRAMLLGWALGLGYFAVSLHWIVEPFLVDVPRHGWMAPFALIFMALGGGFFWALGAVAGQMIGRGVVSYAGLGIGILAAEIARSLVLTGFPWALLGHVWIETPIAGLAAIFGPHGLTLFTVLVAVWMTRGWIWTVSIPVVLMALSLWPNPPIAPLDDAPLVRIVQPNAPQHLKWAPGHAEMFFERQVTMTGAAGAPDLVVWPETSVPYSLDVAEGAMAYVAEQAAGAPVILGGLRREGAAFFNTLAVVDAQGAIADSYDKSHLVPFGEYIPMLDFFARLGLTFGLIEPGTGYSSGDALHVVDVPGIGEILPLICYEGIFAEEVNAAQGRARAIVLITNDAWFGNWAGPEQHFAQARLRAIEQGLPVIRAANTGISGMIDGKGRVVHSIALNTQGFIDVPLPRALDAPAYTRWGDLPVIGLVIALALGHVLVARRKEIDPAVAPS